MTKIPAPTLKRLATAVPKFTKILTQMRERDVNEADTVTVITDILVEVFGFDKYSEVTREYAIQGTYCDLAIKSGKKIDYLIEVKAVGIDLKEKFNRQAVGYAAKEGVKWVVLTNGILWQIYRVTLVDKVLSELLLEFNFLDINIRSSEDQEKLFMLCKRGIQKDQIDKYYDRKQSVNRYMIGTLLLSEPVINIVRRELQKIKEGLKVQNTEIESLLRHEVIKREVLESDGFGEAIKNIKKAEKKSNARKPVAKVAPVVEVQSSESTGNLPHEQSTQETNHTE